MYMYIYIYIYIYIFNILVVAAHGGDARRTPRRTREPAGVQAAEVPLGKLQHRDRDEGGVLRDARGEEEEQEPGALGAGALLLRGQLGVDEDGADGHRAEHGGDEVHKGLENCIDKTVYASKVNHLKG